MLDEKRARLLSASRGLPRLAEILGLPRQRFDAVAERLPRALLANILAGETRLAGSMARLRVGLVRDRIQNGQRGLAEAARRLHEGERRLLRDQKVRLDALGQLLGALSHQGVLARGFALVRDANGRPVARAGDAVPGMAVEIEFQDGRRSAAMTGTKPLPDTIGRQTQKSAGETQGRLF